MDRFRTAFPSDTCVLSPLAKAFAVWRTDTTGRHAVQAATQALRRAATATAGSPLGDKKA